MFFGRDAEQAIMVDKLLSEKLTMLFAETGVGKSSLLQAAVIPELKRPVRENLDVVYHNDWVVEPLERLQQSIRRTLQEGGKIDFDFELDEHLSLKEFLHVCAGFASDPLVIVLDQFEEFFLYQRYAGDFQPFVEQLAEAIRDEATAVVFLISMREDFALNLNAFKGHLPTTLFENYYRLEKLTARKARDAINNPVEKIGFHYEKGLLDELLKDLADQERESRIGSRAASIMDNAPAFVEAPNVQIVCKQLWEAERRNPKKIIRQQVYTEKGGAKGFVDSYFGSVIKGFSAPEKGLASQAFDHLVTPRGTKMAYPVKDLSDKLRVDEKDLGDVLAKLEKARVLRSQDRQGALWYELYHDIFSSIIYQWNTVYKSRQRTKRTIIRSSIVIAVCLGLFVAYDVAMNLTNYHLRLNMKDPESRIELYRGKAESLDIFGLQRYEAETAYPYAQIEPDKRFIAEPVLNYENLNAELIRRLPLNDRFSAYWQAGDSNTVFELANTFIEGRDMTRTQTVINLLAGFRSQEAWDKVLKNYAGPREENIFIRRTTISAALNSKRFTDTISSLIELLGDEDMYVRSDAALLLGQLEAAAAVEPLIARLSDQNEDVRQRVALALGKLGSAAAVEPLIARLSDQNADVRGSVAQALGELGNAAAVAPLIARLSDQNEDVRWRVAGALGELGSAAMEPLIARLSDQSQSVRWSVAQVLGKLGSAAAVEPLIARLSDQNDYVRRRVAEALGELGSAAAVAPLIARLNDQDKDVRQSVAQALGELGSAAAVEPLIARLSDQDESVRQSVAGALGELGSAAAVAPLIARLSDQDADVRESIVFALGTLSTPEAVEPLKHLYHNDPKVKIPAAVVLLFLGQEDGIQFLRDQAQSARRSQSRKVAQALGNAPSDKGNDILLAMLDDERSDVRIQAVNSLKKAQAGSARPHLHVLLDDPNIHIRKAVLEALDSIASVESLDVLKQTALNTQEVFVIRSAAIDALKSLQAENTLIEVLQVVEELYLPQVITILGEMRSENALPILKDLLREQEERRPQWRAIRDEDPSAFDTGQTEEQKQRKQRWEARKAAVSPNRTLEYALAAALTQLDQNMGLELLKHDLASIREGAWTSLAQLPLTDESPYLLENGASASAAELIQRLDRAPKASTHSSSMPRTGRLMGYCLRWKPTATPLIWPL